MTSLEQSGKAGPEEVGILSPANQVEAKEQPEACQRGREPKSGSCTGRAPTGEFGGANYGTSCTGDPQRVSLVQISEKQLRIVPATVRRAAVRTQSSTLDAGPRLDSADIGTKSRPLGAPLPSGVS